MNLPEGEWRRIPNGEMWHFSLNGHPTDLYQHVPCQTMVVEHYQEHHICPLDSDDTTGGTDE